MKDVYPCKTCSNMVLTRTAGFIQETTMSCQITGMNVDTDDGCTFGDCEGPTYGVVPYDIDLSMAAIYQPEYLEY